jgi:hypothetical protein
MDLGRTWAIARKEFIHIRRDPHSLIMIMLLPVYWRPSRYTLPVFASANARCTTSGLVYQLVEPASSAAPHSLFGHHLSPSGVSIELPMTQGLPLQAFQFLSEQS